jgi:hypothetical protein
LDAGRVYGVLFSMRLLMVVALCAALGGCAASSQEVVQRLGSNYIGKSSDELIRDFGPPTSTFKMQSGETSYVWQLASVTGISGDGAMHRHRRGLARCP